VPRRKGDPVFNQHLNATLGAVRALLVQITENQEKIMSEMSQQQADVNAANQAILALLADIQAGVATLNTAVPALQAAIGSLPANVDTTALDAAVAQIAQTRANLDSAVSSVSGLVPPAAPPAS
jgi:peptidoglycan hydrolase CwlO-like protein